MAEHQKAVATLWMEQPQTSLSHLPGYERHREVDLTKTTQTLLLDLPTAKSLARLLRRDGVFGLLALNFASGDETLIAINGKSDHDDIPTVHYTTSQTGQRMVGVPFEETQVSGGVPFQVIADRAVSDTRRALQCVLEQRLFLERRGR